MGFAVFEKGENQRDCSERMARGGYRRDCDTAQGHFLTIRDCLVLRWCGWCGIHWQSSHSIPERSRSVHFDAEPVLQIFCASIVVKMFVRDNYTFDVFALKAEFLQHWQHDRIYLILIVQCINDQKTITCVVRPSRYTRMSNKVEVVECFERCDEARRHREELRVYLLNDALIHEILV